MQLSLPLPVAPAGLTPGPCASESTPTVSDAVVFVRHRRARRYILRVLHDGTLRVTLPRWGVQREAHAFIDASRAWIVRQRARRRPAPVQDTWGDGTEILVDGVRVPLSCAASPQAQRGRRSSERTEVDVSCGDATIATRVPGLDAVRPAVERWLRARASRELPPQLLQLAARHEIAVTRVSIRDQRSRWGACSPTGTITLNWRLIQAPAFVREYVLLHELMHRRELNHSRRFWRLVAACCPRYAEARRWLKEEGKTLWPALD